MPIFKALGRFVKGAMAEEGALRKVGGALKRHPRAALGVGSVLASLGAYFSDDDEDDDDNDDGSVPAWIWIPVFIVGVIFVLLAGIGFYLSAPGVAQEGGGKKINNAMKTINKYSPFIIIFLAYLIYYSYEKYMVLLEEQEKLKEYKKQYFT